MIKRRNLLTYRDIELVKDFVEIYYERKFIDGNIESKYVPWHIVFNNIFKNYEISKSKYGDRLLEAILDKNADELTREGTKELQYSRIHSIGNPQKKINTRGEVVEYIRKPQKIDSEIMLQFLSDERWELLRERYYRYCNIVDSKKFYDNPSLFDNVAKFFTCLNEKAETKLSVLNCEKKDIEGVLIKILGNPNNEEDITLTDEQLDELIASINLDENNDRYDCVEDFYEQFIDRAEITNLVLLYDNADVILEQIEDIHYLLQQILFYDDEELAEVLKVLNHKPRNKYISEKELKIVNIKYPKKIVIDNEKDFRYNKVEQLLRDIATKNAEICIDDIAWCFWNMSSVRWKTITAMLRVYKREKLFNKNVEFTKKAVGQQFEKVRQKRNQGFVGSESNAALEPQSSGS